MGIKSLRSYILRSESISQHCDYKEEVDKWRIDHGCNPTILIDLKEFSNAIISKNTLIKGGIFDKYSQGATHFFAELKKCNVDLVFFAKERSHIDSERSKKKLAKILCEYPSFEKVQRANQRQLNNMMMIAKKHGQLIISSKGYKNSIINYANKHADKVLSLITNDTDYLLYDSKYQYWSMVEWHLQMHGLRFDRASLLADIGLSNEQIRLLVTLSDTLDNWYKFPRESQRMTCKEHFQHAIKYVKEQCPTDGYSFDWKKIATYLYGDDYTGEQLAELEMRYSKFDPNHQAADNENDRRENASAAFRDVLKSFTTNHISSYHAIVDCDRKIFFLKDLCCMLKYDTSTNIEFADAVFSVLAKLPGILYTGEPDERRPVSLKFFNPFIGGKNGDVEMRDIIYPPEFKVTLKQLIVEENNYAYDKERWHLLQWTLGLDDGFLPSLRQTPNMRVVAIALHFLLMNNLIRKTSAKSILHTELDARQRKSPPNSRAKLTQDIRPWIQEAHKYTIVYWLVCRALEMCGLRNKTDLITFNCFKFYEAMETPILNRRKTDIENILFPGAASI